MADSLNLSDSQAFEAAVRAAAEYHGILPELSVSLHLERSLRINPRQKVPQKAYLVENLRL